MSEPTARPAGTPDPLPAKESTPTGGTAAEAAPAKPKPASAKPKPTAPKPKPAAAKPKRKPPKRVRARTIGYITAFAAIAFVLAGKSTVELIGAAPVEITVEGCGHGPENKYADYGCSGTWHPSKGVTSHGRITSFQDDLARGQVVQGWAIGAEGRLDLTGWYVDMGIGYSIGLLLTALAVRRYLRYQRQTEAEAGMLKPRVRPL